MSQVAARPMCGASSTPATSPNSMAHAGDELSASSSESAERARLEMDMPSVDASVVMLHSGMPPPSDRGSEAQKRKDADLAALGARLRTLRAATGMTQEGLASAAGLHWTYIGQIERGERNPTYKNLLRLAAGLGVEPARLMQDG